MVLETKISLGKKVNILMRGKLPNMILCPIFLDRKKYAGKGRPPESTVGGPIVRCNQDGENLLSLWFLSKSHHTNLSEIITYPFSPVVRSTLMSISLWGLCVSAILSLWPHKP